MNNYITILGAGLSGLSAAYFLKQKGIKSHVLEARDRVGGRTYSLKSHNAVLDLGAAWIWPHHHKITALVKELGIQTYPQYEKGYNLFETATEVQTFKPQGTNYPQRLPKGTQEISLRLAEKLTGQVRLNARAIQIQQSAESIRLTLANAEVLETHILIVAVPPRVVANTLIFDPPLPEPLRQTQEQTHTWMGNSAKAFVIYKKPFWRDKQLSGFAISYAGPLGELHDNSPEDASNGVIKGFFAGMKSYESNTQQRRESVIAQLTRLYGAEAQTYLDYHDVAWWQTDLSSAPKDHVPLSDHPPYANPEFRKAYWNGKLYFAGAETAAVQGGYLDGAVEAAKRISQRF